MLIAFLGGCGGAKTDYTDYFSVDSISPVNNETENMLEIDYTVSNLGEENDLVFCVTIDGNTEKYPLNPSDEETDKIVVDIGRPDNYTISYPITYEVKKDDDVIWSKDDSVTYDCTDMFVHHATIIYGEEKQDVKLIDYQSNFFNLSDIFSDFDSSNAHNVIFEGQETTVSTHADVDNNLACIVRNEDDKKGLASAADGTLLRIYTYGKKEINDTFHFSNDLVIKITDALKASDVNWKKHMTFSDSAKYNEVYVDGMQITTYRMEVTVKNPSDEDIYGTVKQFFVNDVAVDDKYLAASDRLLIKAKDTGTLYNVSGASVWKTTGVSSINKFGLKVKLKDKNGNVLYNGIQWLNL